MGMVLDTYGAILLKAGKKEEAEKAQMPYVNERWLGGTLTNFQTVIKQVKKLNALRREKKEGEWNKFSKKEQAMRQKELERLENTIGGLENLKNLPDILYIVDVVKEKLAIREAKKIGIPVVGIVDSNSNPELVDYPIPANDDSLKTIKLITGRVSLAILGSKPVPKGESEETDKETALDREKNNGEAEEAKEISAKKETTEEVVTKKDPVEEIEEKLEEEIDEEEIEAKKAASAKSVVEKKGLIK